MDNIQNVTQAEIQKIGTVGEAAHVSKVARAAAEFYKAQDDKQLSQQAKEIYLRSARRAGELLLPENTPRERGANQDKHSLQVKRMFTPYQEALEGAGITPFIANVWQKLAQITEREFEGYLSNAKFEHTEYTINGLLKYAAMVHVSDDSYEWNTPKEYIEAARRVMGSIDTDPATNENAQKVVRAKTFYTKETNGLEHDWSGNVWLNPPFSMPEIENFIKKVHAGFKFGNVSQACVMVNNATDTKWFHILASRYVFCLPVGRVPFWNENGQTQGGRQGQVIFYLGDRVAEFKRGFSEFGLIVRKI